MEPFPAPWLRLLRSDAGEGRAERLVDDPCRRAEALYATEEVYPAPDNVFRALRLCAPEAARVVVMGQDPYHEPGQADGLAFSVPPGATTPPSLRNILRELSEELCAEPPRPLRGDLEGWARQGVVLLNDTLTVRRGAPGSHAALGWHALTDALVLALARQREGLVFMLWGRPAQRKAALIDPDRHLVLQAAHPSPLAARRGFFGCQHFLRANDYLRGRGQAPIDWGVALAR